MAIDKTSIGLRIKAARETAGLSRQELSEKMGKLATSASGEMSPGTIGMYERGAVNQHVEGLAAIAKALGVSVGSLIEND